MDHSAEETKPKVIISLLRHLAKTNWEKGKISLIDQSKQGNDFNCDFFFKHSNEMVYALFFIKSSFF